MLTRAALMLLCSAIISFSVAQDKKVKEKKDKAVTVFSVAGNPVNVDEFVYLYRKNHQNKDEDFTEAKVDEYLTLFINFKLKVLEARQRGLDTLDSFVKEYNSYKDELRRPYLPDAKLTDSLVRLTYDRMKYEVKVSHILINITPDAGPGDTLKAYAKIIDIRNSIVAGEDFAAAAVTYSEDPSAKRNQGSLGYFTAMQMVYPFETAAYQTQKGHVSMPVRTKFGYHIIKVFDKRPAQGEVEVSHIMIRTGGEKKDENAKSTIFTVYDELQAGVKWEELCKEYSEDPATKDKGGRLRPIGIGAMASVPEFEQMAFFLREPGEISDPFQTQYGWHIIRLEKRIPLPSFQEIEPSLKNRVLRDERTELSKQVIQTKLRAEYQIKENQSVKAAVFALADSSLMKGSWKIPEAQESENNVLFYLRSRAYSVRDFLAYAHQQQRPNALLPGEYLEQLYNNFIDASIRILVEEKIIEENPTYRFLLREYYEGILLFEIMEKEVWNKASEDSSGQHKYYLDHVSSYMAGERAKAVLYSSKSSDFGAPLKEIILSGDEAKTQEFVASKKVKSEAGYYKRDERLALQKVPWAAGVYSTEDNGIYYLAWLKDILPAGPMSFEECRARIISDYQAFLEKMWLEQLKKKYIVKVNEKGKRYILQQLRTD